MVWLQSSYKLSVSWIHINEKKQHEQRKFSTILDLWSIIIIVIVWNIWQKVDVLLATSAQATNSTVCWATQVKTQRVGAKWTVWTQQEWLHTINTTNDRTLCNYRYSMKVCSIEKQCRSKNTETTNLAN